MTSEFLNVYPIEKGQELSQIGGGVVEVINPATGRVVARQFCCDSTDVNRIARSAKEAFNSSQWRGLTAADRGKLLFELAELLEKHDAEIIELEILDTGKPIAQIRDGDLPLAVDIIRFYAGAADKVDGSIKPALCKTLNLTFWEPYGVVAGIVPWNYPLVNATMKLAPALAAGNAVVIKPSVETPLSVTLLAKLSVEAGFPGGVVSTVLGSGSVVGEALVLDPNINKISFTGSTSVGQSIQRKAADQLKPVGLELGGKNAIIVFADADLERAAEATLLSAFVNTGQLCVACSRLLVEQSAAKEFELLLIEKMKKITVDDPRNEATLVGPMITESQYDIALRYISEASKEGCEVLCGGGRKELPPPHDQGYYLQPTLISKVQPDMKIAREEIFGPCLTVTEFSSEEEAVAISNNVEYGLSGSVWTKDNGRALRLIERLDTGIIWVNTMLSGYPQVSVHPRKMSGYGAELGMEALMSYYKRKSAVIGYNDTATVGWDLGRE